MMDRPIFSQEASREAQLSRWRETWADPADRSATGAQPGRIDQPSIVAASAAVAAALPPAFVSVGVLQTGSAGYAISPAAAAQAYRDKDG